MKPAPLILGAWTLGLFVIIGAARAQTPPGKLGTWANEPIELRKWLGEQKIPRTNGASCCGEADAVEVVITGGDDAMVTMRVINGRGYLPDGTELRADRWRILDGRTGTPNTWGRTIVWVSRTLSVYCIAPEAGI
jgi:hypothetical protein